MSRELKFRAFDGNMMTNLDSVNLEMLRRSVISDEDGHFVDCIYMQFTGLKDSKGVDIYESDIVECRNWGQTSEVIGVTSVVWDVDDCGWRYEDSNITEDFYDQFRNVKVIGNIHQPQPASDKGGE